jgi:hypothetical protein
VVEITGFCGLQPIRRGKFIFLYLERLPMPSRPEILIRFLDSTHERLIAASVQPRKCTIKSGFGAMNRRCWLEFYNEDRILSVPLGSWMEVWINQTRCFRGRITQRRIDSIDDQLSLYAIWDPQREFDVAVGGKFENQTVTEILDQLLIGSSLQRADDFYHPIRFAQLIFTDYTLLQAVDLLAKLAGNWLWDIQDNSRLSFHPRRPIPDHTVYLPQDLHGVNLWESTEDRTSEVAVYGGIVQGSTLDNRIAIPGQRFIAEEEIIRIYVRPIAAADAFAALRRSILQQMNGPHYEHYVDLIGWGEKIAPGDTVQFILDEMPLFPQKQIFRVKMREIVYAHENLQTRLHLISGYASTPSYFYYMRNDSKVVQPYLGGKVGIFQLDISALDSMSHIDGE